MIESDVDDSWYGNPNGFLFEAGKAATKRVYNVDPDLTREGGSIPVTISFQQATNNPVILVPIFRVGSNINFLLKTYFQIAKLYDPNPFPWVQPMTEPTLKTKKSTSETTSKAPSC